MQRDKTAILIINFLTPLIFLYGLFILSEIIERGLFVAILFSIILVISFIIFSFKIFDKKTNNRIKIQSDFWLFFIILIFISYLSTILIFIVS